MFPALGASMVCAALVHVASAQTLDDYDWSFQTDAGPIKQINIPLPGGQRRIVTVGWLNDATVAQLYADGIVSDPGDTRIVKETPNGSLVVDPSVFVPAIVTYNVYRGSIDRLDDPNVASRRRTELLDDIRYVTVANLVRGLELLRDIIARAAGIHTGIKVMAVGAGVTVPQAAAQAEAIRRAALEGIADLLRDGMVRLTINVQTGGRILDAEGMKALLAQHALNHGIGCGLLVGAHDLLDVSAASEEWKYEDALLVHSADSMRLGFVYGPAFTELHNAVYAAARGDWGGFASEQLQAIFGNFTWGIFDKLQDRSFLAEAAPHLTLITEEWVPVVADPAAAHAMRILIENAPLLRTVSEGFVAAAWLADYAQSLPGAGAVGDALHDYWSERGLHIKNATRGLMLPWKTATEYGQARIVANLVNASPVIYDGQLSGPGALPGSVILAWTSPTFANGETAHSYEVRYMRYNGFVENIRHAWDTASAYQPGSEMERPNSPGELEILEITGLQPSTPYLFMVRARSPSGVMTPIRGGIVIESSADPSAMRLSNAYRYPTNVDIGTTSVEFSIKYEHDQGQPPATRQLVFDGVSRLMSKVAGDYATGAEYRAVVSGLNLPEDSTHTYYFEFVDGAGNTRREPPTAPDLPLTFTVNTVLRAPSWSPDAGPTPRGFTFRVEYAHPVGIIPTRKQVIVDGDRYDMNFVAGDYRSSAILERRVVIGAGEHEHSFEFHDGTSTIRLPTSGPPFAGPSVAIFRNVGLLLTQGSPPSTMAGGTELSVGVAVRNNGSILETGLSVQWTVNGSPVEPAVDIETVPPGVTSDQQVLRWTPPIQDSYVAPFILAVDILGVSDDDDTEPSDNHLEWSIEVTPPPGSISGTVRDEFNVPVPGATVSVVTGPEQASVETGPVGNYRLTGLPPGDYTIFARTDDGKASGIHSPVTVHAAQDTPLVILSLGTSSIQQMTPSGDEDHSPAWSPDGTRIVYYHKDRNEQNTSYIGTWRVRRLNDSAEWICPDFLSGANFGKPQWVDNNTILIPDAQVLPYGPGIFKVNVPDCTVLDFLPRHLSEGDIGAFTYAPGSPRLFYTVASAIWSCRVSDFGERRQFIQDSTSMLAASHDGQLLATHAGVIRTDNGEYLPTPNWPNGHRISWLPNDEGLVYANSSGKLHAYFLDGRDITLTFGNSSERYPDARPMGTTLIVFQSNMNQGWNSFPLFTLEFDPSDWVCAFTGVTQNAERITPNGDGLDDNLTISYSLTCDAAVTLKVYRYDGEWIATPIKAQAQSAGPNALSWGGSADNGLVVPSGLYFWTLDAHDDAGATALPYRGRVTVVKNDIYVGGAESTLSPDNSWIAYLDTNQPNRLFAADIDGSEVSTVYEAPGGDVLGHPSIAPNNSTIAFTLPDLADPGQRRGIARIERDGSGFTMIARRGDTLSFVISPQGAPSGAGAWNDPSWCPYAPERLVTTVRWHEGGPDRYDVCVMNGDGSGKTVLTRTGHQGVHMYPAFTVDCTSVIFSSDENTTPPNLFTDLFIAPASGGLHVPFTNWLGWEDAPDQTCDGSHLLFGATLLQSWVGANHDLFVMNMDTMQWRPLLGNTFEAHPSCDGRQLLTRNGALVTLDHSLIGGTVEGLVLDEDGQAVETATVEVRSGQDLVAIAVSNAFGAYRASDLPIGSLMVTARRRGYLDSQPVNVNTSAGMTTSNVNLSLTTLPAALVSSIQPGARYAGTVQLAAEDLSTNVSSIAYEFRRKDDTDWTPLGTVSDPPYVQPWDTNDVVAAGQEIQVEVRAIAFGLGDVADADPVPITLVVDRIPPTSVIATPMFGQTVGTQAINLSVQTDTDADRIIVDYKHASDAGVSWRTLAETDQLTESECGKTVTLALATAFLPGEDYTLRAWAVDEAGNVETPLSTVLVTAQLNGDGDGDTDLDLVDAGQFQRCFGMTAAEWDDTCGVFNFNGDSLIDLADWAVFVQVVTGPRAIAEER